MDLRALPRCLPLFTFLIKHLLHPLVRLPVHVDDPHALSLRPVYLPPHRLVIRRRVDLARVQPLLRDGDDRAPPEIGGKDTLDLVVDAAPHRLEALVV